MVDLVWTPDRPDGDQPEYEVVACLQARRRLYVVIETTANPADPPNLVELVATTADGPLDLLGQVQSSQRGGGVIIGRYRPPESPPEAIDISVRTPVAEVLRVVAHRRRVGS